MRLVHTTRTFNDQFAKVFYDRDWEEYRVKFFKDGIYVGNADYHTNDKDDALDTADYTVQQTNLVLPN